MPLERDRENRFVGLRLWAVRAAWVGLVALALWLWAFTSIGFLRQPIPSAAEVSDPGVFTLEDVEILRDMGLPETLAIVPVGFFLVLGIAYFLLSGWIFWRRSNELVPLLVSLALVLIAALAFSYTYEMVNRVYRHWIPLANALTFLGVVLLILVLYIFPDGRFVPRWTRFLPILLGAVLILYYLPVPQSIKFGSWTVSVFGAVATGAYARVHRYHHSSTPLQRQQSQWVGFGLLGLLAVLASYSFWLTFLPASRPGPGRVYALLTVMPISAAALVVLPVSFGIAILRHRLWDIDIFLNRTVVYGPLTGILMGLYIGCIRLFQALFVQFTGEQSSFSILFSTLVLAGVFMPLRLRLQTLADRYFKEVPDPGKGLKAFGQQMRSLAQLTEVGQLTRRLLDETVAAFHAESGAVVVQQDDTPLVQTAGAWSGKAEISVPLEHAGDRLGELSLGARHRGRHYTSQDMETLQDMAGAAAQALALSLRVRA